MKDKTWKLCGMAVVALATVACEPSIEVVTSDANRGGGGGSGGFGGAPSSAPSLAGGGVETLGSSGSAGGEPLAGPGCGGFGLGPSPGPKCEPELAYPCVTLDGCCGTWICIDGYVMSDCECDLEHD
ncbi:MAG: hypothetical protein R3B72_28315 [Polyangiaceae bacterium]